MSKNKSTTHSSGFGAIRFLFAAKPLLNKQKGKEEYVIKLEFDGSDAEALKLKDHLSSINSKKIVTNNVSKAGNFIVSFASAYAPIVLSDEGTKLEGNDIPFFDSRIDSGEASVVYTVVDYGNTQIVRLKGITLKNLQMAEREAKASKEDDLLAKMRNQLKS